MKRNCFFSMVWFKLKYVLWGIQSVCYQKMQSLLTLHPLNIDSVLFVLSFAIEIFWLVKIHSGVISNCRPGYWFINKTWNIRIFLIQTTKCCRKLKSLTQNQITVQSNRKFLELRYRLSVDWYLVDIYLGCKLCGFSCLSAIW